ncbi:hypothetical protein D1AOALGA4SA_7530 [Olavius algarvensis Delta 1 endosymbiont]|nr:hypothetical protein D1AOALGA4SA_7530 [Olavius algarvensis Delta 1 endosymbiont]
MLWLGTHSEPAAKNCRRVHRFGGPETTGLKMPNRINWILNANKDMGLSRQI